MTEKPAHAGGCPYHFGWEAQPKVPTDSDLTYNTYLKIPELLALQHPQSKPAHHDEMLFIIIHQAYELWFKLMLHEMETARDALDRDEPLVARHFLNRIVQIQKLLVSQIHILETMKPVDFLEFRDRLTPASGFQSSQFRELEFLAGLKDDRYLEYFKNEPEMLNRLKRRTEEKDLKTAYYGLLRRAGFNVPKDAESREVSHYRELRDPVIQSLLPIYQWPDRHLPHYLLSESLVDFDQQLSLWRDHHVRVVERIIGFKPGTGGSSGVEYLKSTTVRRVFPLLWELRTELKKE